MSESPAQAAARLRRERRQAKITADPNSRMEKITGRDRVVSDSVTPVSTPTPKPSVADHEDPPEVDISSAEHHYYPTPTARASSENPPVPSMQDMFGGAGPSDAEMQALMSQHPLFRNAAGGMPQLPGMPGMNMPGSEQAGGPGQEDPMMQLFKTLGMEGGGGIPGMEPPEAFPAESPGVAALWQLVHFISMIFIAFFSLRSFDWSGQLSDRLRPLGSEKTDLFYLFGATELGLQGARFILEKGRLQGSGLLKLAAGILPQPWGGYVGTIARYNVIWATLVRDAMCLVFVLGIMGVLGVHAAESSD